MEEKQWISVKDRLPDKKCGEVLVFVPEQGIIGKILTGQYFPADGLLGIWMAYDFEGTMLHENVTHWMPLPEPPKGEQCE